MPTQRDWYDTPHYYDIIFDGGTAQETHFLQQLHYRYATGPAASVKRILEPACGSGRLLQALAAQQWQCAGFDASPPMLAYAQQRLHRTTPPVEIWQDRLESFTAPSSHYSLAHCLVSTFKYLLTEAQAAAHLQLVARSLLPGGIYVLGIHLTDYSRNRPEHERWVATRGTTQVVCNTRSWPADPHQRLERLRTRLRVIEDGTTRTQETHWQFRTYNAQQLQSLLSAVPQFTHLASYDFQHDIQQPRPLDDSYSDIVVVLHKGSQ
jgi:SAM-dependent methyltransferase